VPTVKNASDLHLSALSVALNLLPKHAKREILVPSLFRAVRQLSNSFKPGELWCRDVYASNKSSSGPEILGVCTIINRPVNLGNSTFGFVPYIGLSLTYDHRAIDGGPATLFLEEIKEQIEAFRY